MTTKTSKVILKDLTYNGLLLWIILDFGVHVAQARTTDVEHSEHSDKTHRRTRSSNPHGGVSLERETLYGRVEGTRKRLHFLEGKPMVERYLGVPYAKPPVGHLRFEVSM